MTKIVIAEQIHKWVERCGELQKENTQLKSKLQLKETAYDFDTARLEEENAQLKELLKECKQQFEEVTLYRYDVSDTDQEDWFKISTEQAGIANKMITKIDEALR